jgi:hypothetical protein
MCSALTIHYQRRSTHDTPFSRSAITPRQNCPKTRVLRRQCRHIIPRHQLPEPLVRQEQPEAAPKAQKRDLTHVLRPRETHMVAIVSPRNPQAFRIPAHVELRPRANLLETHLSPRLILRHTYSPRLISDPILYFRSTSADCCAQDYEDGGFRQSHNFPIQRHGWARILAVHHFDTNTPNDTRKSRHIQRNNAY